MALGIRNVDSWFVTMDKALKLAVTNLKVLKPRYDLHTIAIVSQSQSRCSAHPKECHAALTKATIRNPKSEATITTTTPTHTTPNATVVLPASLQVTTHDLHHTRTIHARADNGAAGAQEHTLLRIVGAG